MRYLVQIGQAAMFDRELIIHSNKGLDCTVLGVRHYRYLHAPLESAIFVQTMNHETLENYKDN